MKYYENELKYPSNNNTQLSEDNFNNYRVVFEYLNNCILDQQTKLNNLIQERHLVLINDRKKHIEKNKNLDN
jgi:hypothetical protein